MNGLKELKKWISAYEKANNLEPPLKNIKLKINEILANDKELLNIISKKIYFRDCIYSDYETLRIELASNLTFVEEYRGVDLKCYIDEAMAWSEKGNLTTENGWLLTLKNWMRKAKIEGRLIMKYKPVKNNVQGHINY